MTPKQKKTVSNWAAVMVLLTMIIVIVATCSSDNEESTVDTQAVEKLKSDSTTLLAHLNEDIVGAFTLQRIPATISEFNSKTCKLRVMMPKDKKGRAASVIGVDICTRATKWLADEGYTVGYDGVYVSCSVYSPYEGVTGKDGMVILWGSARYNTHTDTVEWEWEKTE